MNAYLWALCLTIVALALFKIYTTERNDSYCKKLLDEDPLWHFKNHRWLGFNKSMDADSAMSHAVDIGVISKLERKKLWLLYSKESMGGREWPSVIFIDGSWFNGGVEKIGFRFDILSNKLTEVRLVFKNFSGRIYPEYDINKEYEKLEKRISKSRGPSNTWEDIGISIRATDNQNRITLDLFFTPPNNKKP